MVPEQSHLSVGQNAPADLLNAPLFEAMAGIQLHNGGIHTESENAADKALNSIRQRWLAGCNQTLHQLNDITALDRSEPAGAPLGKDMLAEVSLVRLAAAPVPAGVLGKVTLGKSAERLRARYSTRSALLVNRVAAVGDLAAHGSRPISG